MCCMGFTAAGTWQKLNKIQMAYAVWRITAHMSGNLKPFPPIGQQQQTSSELERYRSREGNLQRETAYISVKNGAPRHLANDIISQFERPTSENEQTPFRYCADWCAVAEMRALISDVGKLRLIRPIAPFKRNEMLRLRCYIPKWLMR